MQKQIQSKPHKADYIKEVNMYNINIQYIGKIDREKLKGLL